MCGIVGVFNYATREGVRVGDLVAMTEAIRHRGPDDHGLHLDGRLGLGMRRLAIIDVAGGRQPVANEDGTVVSVFNGEIYNYRALQGRLARAGHRLTTSSDTEVIPHLYEDLGDDVVAELRGMFGLAVWDAGHQRLLLARDRLGIKPLYYLDDGRRLVFASEIKALLAHPGVDASVDPVAVNQYLSLRYVPAPRTMFAGVRALPPGMLLTCDERGPRLRRWWDIPAGAGGPVAGDRSEWAQELAARLRESVRLHVQSDVPFGAFLSGGLDSSMVVALMAECLAEPVKTYAVGYIADGRPVGELSHAAVVARRFATDHHEVVMTGADFAAAAPRLVWHLDQPLGDVATVPMLLLAERAAQDVKMVLSGEGGDELFAGYARHVGERFAPLLRPLPGPVRASMFGAAQRLTSDRRAGNVLGALARRDTAVRLASWFPLLGDDLRAAVSSDALLADDVAPSHELFGRLLAEGGRRSHLEQLLYCDTKLWLPDLLLARADKVSMAASLELRVPLLDHHLVEFAATVPPSLKVRGLQRKVLLRKVAEELVPASTLARKKDGFSVPVGAWFREDARELVHDALAPAVVGRRGLLDSAVVQRLVDAHDSGAADHAFVLWALVSLELWMQAYIDRSGQPSPPLAAPSVGRCTAGVRESKEPA